MSDPVRSSQSPLKIIGGLYMEIAILLFCAAILLGTGRTKGPVFDVVGPDFLPTVVAYLVGALTLLQILVQVVKARRGEDEASVPAIGLNDVGFGFLFSATTGLYVATLNFRLVPYFLATAIFVTLATLMLTRRLSLRDAGTGAVIGLVLGIVLQYIFTHVLVIDLPT